MMSDKKINPQNEIRQSVISESESQEKNDKIVVLTPPQDSSIYASEYSLYLPAKALLQQKLAERTAEFEKEHGGDGE